MSREHPTIESFVTTAKRRVPTLGSTLMSLVDAGFLPTIIAEPNEGAPTSVGSFKVLVSEKRLGPWGALRRALTIGVERKPDFVAVFQDDVRLAHGTREWLLEQLAGPDGERLWSAGVVSLYTASAYDDGIEYKGWLEVPRGDLPRRAYGALALVFPVESAKLLLASPPNPEQRIRADLNTAMWARLANRSFLCHSPSLVWHTGLDSVAHPGAKESVFRQAGRVPADVEELGQWNDLAMSRQ
jgi:hypothetical protein